MSKLEMLIDHRSFEAWLYVERFFEERKLSPIVSVGPFKLLLASPGIPTLLVQEDELHSSARFGIGNNFRGNCGNLEMLSMKTKSTEEAAEKCFQLPGTYNS